MISKSLQARFAAALAAILFAGAAQAHWSLDNDASSLSFVTVKAEHVAEVHTFDSLSLEQLVTTVVSKSLLSWLV